MGTYLTELEQEEQRIKLRDLRRQLEEYRNAASEVSQLLGYRMAKLADLRARYERLRGASSSCEKQLAQLIRNGDETTRVQFVITVGVVCSDLRAALGEEEGGVDG